MSSGISDLSRSTQTQPTFEYKPTKGNAGKCCGMSIEGLMFILGIIFWAVGAANGNVSMETAGIVLFSLSMAGLAITCCCVCCLGAALLGSGPPA